MSTNGGAEPRASRSPISAGPARGSGGEAGVAATLASAPEGEGSDGSGTSWVLRKAYWLLWFGAVPIVSASFLVWVLTPPSGIERGGVIGLLETGVREQPVPVGIGLFTLFMIVLWTLRYRLPLSRHAHPPLRPDLPAPMRAPFERARVLLEEADGILDAHAEDIRANLSASDRDKLHTDLDALRAAMKRVPFDTEAFVDALVRADGEVDVRLRRWRKSEVREYVESILVAVAVALALRAFVVEAFKIPSGSMIPTLQVGDHIFVNKFVYGPAVPWTRARLWTSMPPSRGDVMVFAFPERPEQDFIKRVIAQPGDKLEVRSGHPIINGWEVPSCFVGTYKYHEYDATLRHEEAMVDMVYGRHEGDLYVEYLEDEAYLTLYDRGSGGFPERQGPYTVKAGEVWVMGDNRNNSHDSRMWWGGQGGGVPYENVKGKAMFVWLSVGEVGIDWSRLGQPVMGRPRVPASMKHLEPAIDKCLRDRPPLAKTTPPRP
jgi:signal peptidase I